MKTEKMDKILSNTIFISKSLSYFFAGMLGSAIVNNNIKPYIIVLEVVSIGAWSLATYLKYHEI